jgi:hypothetical protein
MGNGKMNKEEFDIATEMERLLSPVVMKRQASDNSIGTALDNLIKAAEMLEEDHNYAMAEAVTDLMERIPTAIKRGLQ